MNKSESIKNIADALSKFQGEIENPKNTADNPFFKSKYAPLQDVLNLVRPKLAKYGLSILQFPSGDGEKIVIHSLLMHSSGEWIEMEPLILKAEKATAQGAGSAITYGRRYALSAILGISSEDDDDGNQASNNEDKPKAGGNRPSAVKTANKTKTGPRDDNNAGDKEIFNCESCGIEITKAEKSYSEHYYGKLLCKNCQKIYQKLK
jgi:hypothetical protein